MLIAEKATSYSEDSALNRTFKGVYGFAFLAVVSPTGLRYLSCEKDQHKHKLLYLHHERAGQGPHRKQRHTPRTSQAHLSMPAGFAFFD